MKNFLLIVFVISCSLITLGGPEDGIRIKVDPKDVIKKEPSGGNH